MDAFAREDYLEAVLNLEGSRQGPPSIMEVAKATGKEVQQTTTDLHALRDAGDVCISAIGTVALTPEGKKTAESVSRKHRLLQCFLTEMLGLEPAVASGEACMLEHAVSDETIDRLGRYLDQPGADRVRRHARHGKHSGIGPGIADFEENTELRVRQVLAGREVHRLIDLGIVPGEKIRLLRKIGNHAVLVRVKGCDIALSDEVAASIRVEPLP